MRFIDYLKKREIINKYNIISIDILSGGLVNKVYKIRTKNQVYVVKVFNDYNVKYIDKIEKSEELANVCIGNNINAVAAIKIHGKNIQKIGDDYVTIYKYVDGFYLDNVDINDFHIRKIAALLGKIHNINYQGDYQKVIRKPIDWMKYANALESNETIYKDLYLKNYKKYNDVFDMVIKIKNAKKVTLGICHRDIKPSNVLWFNQIPYLIDFESSRIDDISLDFIETMLRWSDFTLLNIDYNKIRVFVNEYKKHIDIKNMDYKEVLMANLIGRFDFLHFNLEITLVEKTKDESDYLRASNEVINMINEINYYLKIIDELSLFLGKL